MHELRGVCHEKNLITTTEDGTAGLQCLVTQPLADLLAKEKFDMIYTCGPEIMVKKIFELTEKNKLPLEASLERLMRCGIGLCGSCMIGKYRVCRDGPVFNAAQLREMQEELGISKLGFDGSSIPILTLNSLPNKLLFLGSFKSVLIPLNSGGKYGSSS